MELALFAQHLDRVEYVGEIGLDRSREGRATYSRQVKVFEHLLGQPLIRAKVLTVHSRGAEGDVIERLAAADVTAILHWYSGALKHIDAAVEAGIWFSVNAAMLRSQAGLRIVRSLPKERVVTETDGPFVKLGSRTSQPSEVPETVRALASVWGEDRDKVASRIFDTMCKIAETAKSA